MSEIQRQPRSPRRASFMARVAKLTGVALLLTAAGCGGAEDGASDLYDPPEEISPPSPPTNPQTVADIFPATGYRGLVVNNCATCHSAACAAIGQRTREEWRAVEQTHLGAVAGLSAEDRGKIFDFLRRNFNDTLPEPSVPPQFLAGGCNPDVVIPPAPFH
jgi:hypothetical protein